MELTTGVLVTGVLWPESTLANDMSTTMIVGRNIITDMYFSRRVLDTSKSDKCTFGRSLLNARNRKPGKASRLWYGMV